MQLLPYAWTIAASRLANSSYLHQGDIQVWIQWAAESTSEDCWWGLKVGLAWFEAGLTKDSMVAGLIMDLEEGLAQSKIQKLTWHKGVDLI